MADTMQPYEVVFETVTQYGRMKLKRDLERDEQVMYVNAMRLQQKFFAMWEQHIDDEVLNKFPELKEKPDDGESETAA